MRVLVSLLSAVLTLCVGPLAQAADPVRAIPYSGKLEVDGSAPSASFTMNFALFDASTAGNNLWNETMTVSVTSGAFAVVLGTTPANPLPDPVFLAAALYIEVTVDPAGSKTVLAPRQAIYAAPQALRGRIAETFSTYGDIWMPPVTYIRGLGRLHIENAELLYLLAKSGVNITADHNSAGTLYVQNTVTAGGLSAGWLSGGTLTLGDVNNSSATAHITGSNSYGSLIIENRDVNGAGGLFFNYNTLRKVYFGQLAASVDASTGDISTKGNVSATGNITADGSVTVKGGVKSHSDVTTRCQTPSNQCAGDGYTVGCPAGMYVQSFYLRAGNCSTVTCCYPDT